MKGIRKVILLYTPEHYQKYKRVITAAKERYRKKNMDKWREAQKKVSWERRTFQSLKTRAKKRGLDFTLELSDLVAPALCPVFGIAMTTDGGMNDPASASVDRFDNTKGYTKENIRIISMRANALKRDGTLEEFRKLVAWLEK